MPIKRWKIELTGQVQGIGFRPLIWHLANSLFLEGFVRNQANGVVIEIQGPSKQLEQFVTELEAQLPELARIDSHSIVDCQIDESANTQVPDFRIESSDGSSQFPFESAPDLAPCDNCLSELFDSKNRRYLYPMISCTRCGPRFSITQSSPYDRHCTTLADFPLCQQCKSEYTEPSNRRFHAQTIGCFACGPQWVWIDGQLPSIQCPSIQCNQASMVESILERCAGILNSHGVILIKGVGGYQLMCDATSQQATARIRKLKHRDYKPFAVLFDNIQSALEHLHLSSPGTLALQRSHRPIVVGHFDPSSQLLRANPSLSPLTASLGAMLPNNPMQFLLAGYLARPLVATSANNSNEPMLIDDRQAMECFGDQVDAVLMHPRKIAQPLDDPVLLDTAVGLIPVRQGRGDSPCRLPFRSHQTSSKVAIALGADLKTAWGMLRSNSIYLMQPLGDASSPTVIERVEHSVVEILESEPPTESIACDLHPNYHTSMLAEKLSSPGFNNRIRPDLRPVQHHAAHLASLAVDLKLNADEPLVGFVFDGTGLGNDGGIWGGELIGLKHRDYFRLGHLRYFHLPRGDLAAKSPWRSALALLLDCGLTTDEIAHSTDWSSHSPWGSLSETDKSNCIFSSQTRSLNTTSMAIPSSSMGRWIDGLASLIGLVHTNDFEGHAAMVLEDLATLHRRDDRCVSASDIDLSQIPYRFDIRVECSSVQFDGRPVVRGVLDDLRRGISKNCIAYRIHASIAWLIVEALQWIEKPWGEFRLVGLSGGVFQNRLLTEMCSSLLSTSGYRACIHRQIPPNDSGIAVGQLRMVQQGTPT